MQVVQQKMERLFACCPLALWFLWVLAPGLAPASLSGQPEKKRFSILEQSQLYLKGTTNVNTFTCACEDRFNTQVLEVESNDTHARFQRAQLSMTTKKFNCRNAKMDHDMYKALKADQFPQIKIELLESWQNSGHLKSGNKDWVDVKARVKLTIAGVAKEQTIQAKVKALSPVSFKLHGEKALLMSEYGIEPPTALFGMIHVDDLITFYFDLTVQVGELQFDQKH